MPNTILEREIYELAEADLDAFPLGLVEVDDAGTILAFNAAQQELGRRSKASTIGLNFFRDVAPCTAVREFQGRFTEFVVGGGLQCEEFSFVFRFDWGDREIRILFMRRPIKDRYFIVVNTLGVDIVHEAETA